MNSKSYAKSRIILVAFFFSLRFIISSVGILPKNSFTPFFSSVMYTYLHAKLYSLLSFVKIQYTLQIPSILQYTSVLNWSFFYCSDFWSKWSMCVFFWKKSFSDAQMVKPKFDKNRNDFNCDVFKSVLKWKTDL